MTESEIIKALECISGKIFYCSDCAYRCGSVVACHKKSAKDAIDLINCKNAEIELLENESKRQATKAIKEFAEMVKQEDGENNHIFDDCASILVPKEYRRGREEKINEFWETIYKIAKEMGVEL